MYTIHELEVLKTKGYDKLIKVIGEYLTTDHYSKSREDGTDEYYYYLGYFADISSDTELRRDNLPVFPFGSIDADVERMVIGLCKVGDFNDAWLDADSDLRFFRSEYDSVWKLLEEGYTPVMKEGHDAFLDYITSLQAEGFPLKRDVCLVREWKKGLRIMTIRSLMPRAVWDKEMYCRNDAGNLLCLPSRNEGFDVDRDLWNFRFENEEMKSGNTSLFDHDIQLEEDVLCRFPVSFLSYLYEKTSVFDTQGIKPNILARCAKIRTLQDDSFPELRNRLSACSEDIEDHVEEMGLWEEFANLCDTAANRILVPFPSKDFFAGKFIKECDPAQRLRYMKLTKRTADFHPTDFTRYVNSLFLWDYVKLQNNSYWVKEYNYADMDYPSWVREEVMRLRKRAVFMEAMAKIVMYGNRKNTMICGKAVYKTICEKVLFTDVMYEGYEEVFHRIRTTVLCYDLEDYPELQGIHYILAEAEDAIRLLGTEQYMVEVIEQTFKEEI